jgi:murein DD-endopeptidase MepM/ murein hydrolase activator NlpD
LFDALLEMKGLNCVEKVRKIRTGWPLGILALLFAGGLTALIWFAAARLEGEGPSVALDAPSPFFIGKSTELTLDLADPKSGLRRLRAELSKDGKDLVLADVVFPASGFLGMEKVRSAAQKLKIDPAALGLSDGKGLLRISVEDGSWRNWWHGNRTDIQKEIVIDTKPPGIENLNPQNYVNQGGTGLAVYRLSEPCPASGVRVGGEFYPGSSGYYADPAVHIAFFALSYQQGSGAEIVIEATDAAGNSARSRYPYHFRKKAFKKDTLIVSDGFINQILPEFSALLPAATHPTLKDRFLFINRDLRKANYQSIIQATRRSEPAMLWKGPFLRLPNSAPRAGFADHRTYLYEGKEIDQQDHLGVDLASLAQSPVPAANSGIVVYAGGLGIYGQTVILDHGFGVFSMYSHLSRIAVRAGERVAREGVLGNTGSTGLAGGDHLHFSMLIHHTFVDPIEWWDPHWIQDNVMLKLESVKGGSGTG